MFNKKRLKVGFKIIFCLFLLTFLVVVTPITLSKYEMEAESVATTDLAMYVMDTNYYTESIKLMDLVPRTEPYIYTFTVMNHKNGYRTDTNIEYDLSLKMTTNMPLQYQLYKNFDTSNNLFLNSETTTDEHGVYYKILHSTRETMIYTNDVTNTYTLYVYFPLEYNTDPYSDLMEYVEIIVDSKQIIS